jgi:hypothetical protein
MRGRRTGKPLVARHAAAFAVPGACRARSRPTVNRRQKTSTKSKMTRTVIATVCGTLLEMIHPVTGELLTGRRLITRQHERLHLACGIGTVDLCQVPFIALT